MTARDGGRGSHGPGRVIVHAMKRTSCLGCWVSVVTTLAGCGGALAGGPFVSVRRFTWTDADNHQLQAFVGDSSALSEGRYAASEVRAHDGAPTPEGGRIAARSPLVQCGPRQLEPTAP